MKMPRERKKGDSRNMGSLIGSTHGSLKKRDGIVFSDSENRLLFFCFSFSEKRTVFLKIKENFFTPYYKKQEKINEKGGVFFGREKECKGTERKEFQSKS